MSGLPGQSMAPSPDMVRDPQGPGESAANESGRPSHGAFALGLIRRFAREPLLHFLLLGGLIFALYSVLSPVANRAQTDRIVLTQNDLRQLAVQWLAQGRPPPTPEEMRSLIEQRVREEILFREAIALGLDKDDEIIKRRLAQKMDFLSDDIAALQAPDEAQLRVWFTQNESRFAKPPRVTFHHLYFSSDRGPGAQQAADAALVRIAHKTAAGATGAAGADPFMFQDFYAERTPEQVTREFGPQFTQVVFQLKPGAWQGPVQSGYGWHLVFVDTLEPGRTPAFEEIEADVRSAWLDQRQQDVKRAALEAFRARYTVIVPPLESIDWDTLRSAQLPTAPMDVTPQ
jgi:peptidyl-prolyl cis-trans isomerase C